MSLLAALVLVLQINSPLPGTAAEPVKADLTWHTDIAAANKLASQSGKSVLIYFSGSDWCHPCIKLNNSVFQSEAFRALAKKNLVLVKADFPQRKRNRLTAEQTAHNEALAEKYNRKGLFPLVVLTSHDGEVFASFAGFSDPKPEPYLMRMHKALSDGGKPQK